MDLSVQPFLFMDLGEELGDEIFFLEDIISNFSCII